MVLAFVQGPDVVFYMRVVFALVAFFFAVGALFSYHYLVTHGNGRWYERVICATFLALTIGAAVVSLRAEPIVDSLGGTCGSGCEQVSAAP